MATFVKNVMIVGNRGCGKTCLLDVFISNWYEEKYVPTACTESPKTTHIELDEFQIELRTTDAWGNAVFDGRHPQSNPSADVVLMCFAIDAPETLKDVQNVWYPVIQQYCPAVPIILVGNMKDLRLDTATVEKLARWRDALVTCDAVKDVAAKINAIAYLECSAKTKDGVREVFETATRAALKNEKDWKKHQKTDRSCCVVL